MCSLSQLGQCATAPVQAVRLSAVHFRLFREEHPNDDNIMMLASLLICDTATAHAACFTQFTGPEMRSMRLLIKGRDLHRQPWVFFGPPVPVPEKNRTQMLGRGKFTGTGKGFTWVPVFLRVSRVTGF